eukprot:4646574-Pyramimonas_sp.AAC.3
MAEAQSLRRAGGWRTESACVTLALPLDEGLNARGGLVSGPHCVQTSRHTYRCKRGHCGQKPKLFPFQETQRAAEFRSPEVQYCPYRPHYCPYRPHCCPYRPHCCPYRPHYSAYSRKRELFRKVKVGVETT